MGALSSEEKQIVELFQRLPPDRRSQVILALTKTDSLAWTRYQAQGANALWQAAAERGRDWNTMTDEERQDFVEVFLEEDRP